MEFANLLPNDIIILILSFGNEIKYRRGKFINQILKDDPRRERLKKIQRPIFLPNFSHEYMDENIHYINQEKRSRVFLTIKSGIKEMIYYTFEKENIYYYGMIYVSKGRHIGYSKKRLYSIDVITDKNGFQYNQYKFVVEDEI